MNINNFYEDSKKILYNILYGLWFTVLYDISQPTKSDGYESEPKDWIKRPHPSQNETFEVLGYIDLIF